MTLGQSGKAQTPSAGSEKEAESRVRLEALGDPVAILESIFAFAPVGLQIFRADGRSLVVNDAFRRLFGSEPPPDYNILHDAIAARAGVLSLIHRAFAGETVRVPATWYDPRELERVCVTEGRKVAIEATFFPLFGLSGAVDHVGITYKDVTDELRARAALLLERDRLTLLVNAGDTLSASIDYETTLHNVAGLAMPTLADFCFFDVVESGGGVRRIARAHANPAAQTLLAQTRWARSERADINVCALSSGASGFHPDVDESWLKNVAVSSEHLDLMRELAFCSLISVPLKLQDRLLGALTLCFAESRRHGGSVRVESEGSGRGAQFFVRLPANPEAAASREPGEPAAISREAPSGGTELQGLRVLVVDDEPDALDVTARIFAIAGADVVVAASASEAILALEAGCPDVLVSDIGMPERDGYSLLREIRALPPPAGSIAAIALTAYASPEDAERALDAGFWAHIAKPAAPDALIEAALALAGRRAR